MKKWFLTVLLALTPLYAQIVQVQNAGTNVGVVPSKYFKLNCAAGLSCATSGVTITVTPVGGGSGTVNTGIAGHFAYYATSTTAVSNNTNLDDGITTANTLTYAGSAGISALSFTTTGAATPDVYTEQTAPSTPAATKVNAWADSTDHRFHEINSSGTIGTTVVANAGSANNFFTALSAAGVFTTAQPSSSSLSDNSILVKNNGVNTGTTAVTMDLSASTVANAFKVPVGAGLTSGADGVVAYDTTNKNTHVRSNAADALVMASAANVTSNFFPKSASSTVSAYNTSALQDTGSQIVSTEPFKFGTAGSVPNADLTTGSTTAAMTIQTTATLTNVTGMTWNILANKNYRLACEIPITFAASATIQFAMGGPGTPTSYNLDAYGLIGAAAVFGDFNTLGAATYGTKTTASGAPGALAEVVHINGFIQNGATASGTALTLQTAANGTNGITIGANAWCDLKQVN